jgi:beta-mannosidase
MVGLDPCVARAGFFYAEVPSALELAEVDALYVPSAPCGADRPLLQSQGVSNWFGVGGYRQPLSAVRAAGVRFASECLAIANIGDDVSNLDSSNWKDGVARDVGSDWDFDDVRNHYLELLYDVNSDHMRDSDPERWLDLSRQASGEVMSEVFGEWRRPDSGCGGGFILWLRDLVPGAGWGLLDNAGRPKRALRGLSKVLAPIAVWMTDEGMGGYAVHVANDRPQSFLGKLLVQVSTGGRMLYASETSVEVAANGVWSGDVETILGKWVDVAYNYRFGPPAHDLVTAQLLAIDSSLIGDARRYPIGRGAVS